VWKWSYEYDRFGNRWNKTLLAGSGTEHTLSFNYPDNRITTAAYGYDNSGNLTAAGPGTSFVYNAESFMTSATSSPGAGTYLVDALGRRVKKTVSGTITHYFYSGYEIISELSGSAWTDYIFFSGQRIAKQTGSTLATATFLHTDHLGSVRRCTDSTGAQNGSCDYEPFGEGQSVAGCTVPSNFRFAGMLWDAESNLNHTWFRQYDSAQGRWMSVDPLPGNAEDPQTLNRYVYARNDPVNLVDPSGLSCQWWGLFWIRWEIGGGIESIEFVEGSEYLVCDPESDQGGGGGGQGEQQGDKPECSFTVSTNGFLSTQARSTLDGIFRNAGVGLQFVQGQNADFRIQLNYANPGGQVGALGYFHAPSNTAQINSALIGQTAIALASNQGQGIGAGIIRGQVAIGVVSAHELGHGILGAEHSQSGLMMSGHSQGANAFNPALTQVFTPQQAASIQQRCRELHP